MLYEALRLLRVFHDLKQNELAERLNVSKSYISEIEKGNRTPSLDLIDRYAQVFKVPVSSIMFFSEQIESAQKEKAAIPKARQAIASKIIKFLQVIEDRTEADGVG
jgi:transcriptional regulator with XRE-family HTH domain